METDADFNDGQENRDLLNKSNKAAAQGSNGLRHEAIIEADAYAQDLDALIVTHGSGINASGARISASQSNARVLEVSNSTAKVIEDTFCSNAINQAQIEEASFDPNDRAGYQTEFGNLVSVKSSLNDIAFLEQRGSRPGVPESVSIKPENFEEYNLKSNEEHQETYKDDRQPIRSSKSIADYTDKDLASSDKSHILNINLNAESTLKISAKEKI